MVVEIEEGIGFGWDRGEGTGWMGLGGDGEGGVERLGGAVGMTRDGG